MGDFVMGDNSEDLFNLTRFVVAQQNTYDRAISEIRCGRKESHWMWFIFPQFAGLGSSFESRLYAINSLEEARAYLHHPVLGPRLIEITKACLEVKDKTAYEIFGTPDDLKLHSSMTLFAQISPSGSVFHQVLDRYFNAEFDPRSLELIYH